MAEKLIVQSSPHIESSDSTSRIMQRVLIALIPSGVFAVVLFGVKAAVLIAVCAIACPLFEFIWEKLLHRPSTVSDFSAVVTGVLLAYNLPPELPIWMAILGCLFAIIVIKQFFGGIGQNFVNPAIAGRIFLLISFAGPMSQWLVPSVTGAGVDLMSGATPLSNAGAGLLGAPVDYLPLLLGFKGGCIGEVSAIALLLGGIYLVATKVISPLIPVAYMGTVAVLTLVCGYNPLYHLLTGGLMIGAIFMATDYVTSPVTKKGKLIFAVGCGIITVGIRLFGNYPEGVSFAIILMNIVTPLIDNYCKPTPFGALKPAKGGAAK